MTPAISPEARDKAIRAFADPKFEYAIERGKPADPWLKLFRWEPDAPFPVLRYLHGDWVVDHDWSTSAQIESALKKGDLMTYANRTAALTLSGVQCLDRYVIDPLTVAPSAGLAAIGMPTVLSLMSYDAEWYAAEISFVRQPSEGAYVVVESTTSFPSMAAQSEHEPSMRKHISSYLQNNTRVGKWRSIYNASVSGTLAAWRQFRSEEDRKREEQRLLELAALEQRMREKPASLTADEFSSYMAKLRGED